MRRALVLATTIAIGGVFADLAASGAFDSGDGERSEAPPATKTFSHFLAVAGTVHAMSTMAQATRDALPTLALNPSYTPPTTCPRAFPTPYVRPHDPAKLIDPDFKHGPETSEGFARGSDSKGYGLAAGSPDSQRWFIAVYPKYADPCAAADRGADPNLFQERYEISPGPITLTQIDGATILFTKGDRGTGRLNYVTGTLLPP